ncbi:MAG: metallophosphoesterase [Bacteroidetes bacterium]|nr:metallophosphoesterase [Bacteroidota bacterium]
MTTPLLLFFRFILFILFLLVIDWYVFRGFKTALSSMQNDRLKLFIFYGFWTINIAFIALVVFGILNFSRNTEPSGRLFFLVGSFFILLTVPKLIITLFLLTEDVVRIFRAAVLWTMNTFIYRSVENKGIWMARREFISQLSIVIAAIPFVGIIHGILKGRYKYTVHKVTLTFKDLPDAFHGFKITQLSDIHAGSFDNYEAVKKGGELANAQKSDMVVFTGDLVNNFAHEIKPWIDLFKTLDAPFGKYSITGNHDYADYVEWKTLDEKRANFNALLSAHAEMGFKILLNENISVTKNGQSIRLIGIENWGAGGFAKYGDFEKSLEGVIPAEFKILLSHDPSHWENQVLNHKQHIHLALAGHTHGMQFGIEIPGIKWSPVKYRYPRWAGLYEEKSKYLYVNRGFGFIGFPGRVGIWPEVTVIELQKG